MIICINFGQFQIHCPQRTLVLGVLTTRGCGGDSRLLGLVNEREAAVSGDSWPSRRTLADRLPEYLDCSTDTREGEIGAGEEACSGA